MKISLNVCKRCHSLNVIKPGMKFFTWGGGINDTENTYYCCYRHRDCTMFRGIPPLFLKESFENEDVPERCEFRMEYELTEWNKED